MELPKTDVFPFLMWFKPWDNMPWLVKNGRCNNGRATREEMVLLLRQQN